MAAINQGKLNRLIIYITGVCRVLLVAMVWIFDDLGKLIKSEFIAVFCIIMPITFLYAVFITKYLVVRNRYLQPGNIVPFKKALASCAPLLAAHIIEALVITFKSHLNTQDGYFCYYIAFCECLIAAYAGYYLSDLFNEQIA